MMKKEKRYKMDAQNMPMIEVKTMYTAISIITTSDKFTVQIVVIHRWFIEGFVPTSISS